MDPAVVFAQLLFAQVEKLEAAQNALAEKLRDASEDGELPLWFRNTQSMNFRRVHLLQSFFRLSYQTIGSESLFARNILGVAKLFDVEFTVLLKLDRGDRKGNPRFELFEYEYRAGMRINALREAYTNFVYTYEYNPIISIPLYSRSTRNHYFTGLSRAKQVQIPMVCQEYIANAVSFQDFINVCSYDLFFQAVYQVIQLLYILNYKERIIHADFHTKNILVVNGPVVFRTNPDRVHEFSVCCKIIDYGSLTWIDTDGNLQVPPPIQWVENRTEFVIDTDIRRFLLSAYRQLERYAIATPHGTAKPLIRQKQQLLEGIFKNIYPAVGEYAEHNNFKRNVIAPKDDDKQVQKTWRRSRGGIGVDYYPLIMEVLEPFYEVYKRIKPFDVSNETVVEYSPLNNYSRKVWFKVANFEARDISQLQFEDKLSTDDDDADFDFLGHETSTTYTELIKSIDPRTNVNITMRVVSRLVERYWQQYIDFYSFALLSAINEDDSAFERVLEASSRYDQLLLQIRYVLSKKLPIEQKNWKGVERYLNLAIVSD